MENYSLNNCTFATTGKIYQKQYWKHCATCFTDQDEGVCLNCVSLCHEGHKLGKLKFSQFFCDCGANFKCKRGIFKEIVKDKIEKEQVEKKEIEQRVIMILQKKYLQILIMIKYFHLLVLFLLFHYYINGAKNNTDIELSRLFGSKYDFNDLKNIYSALNNNIIKMSVCLAINDKFILNSEYVKNVQEIALVTNENFNDSAAVINKLNNFIKKKYQ